MAVIIVIDDDYSIRRLIKFTLEKEHYKVITAEDALEGINTLNSRKIDLIILDIIMPDIDGYEALKVIKSSEQLKDIPVLLLTAKNEIDDMMRGFELGADEYLAKPFELSELLARIRNLLRIKELQNKILQAERMAAVGQIALTIRHEINNPLTAVIGQCEMILRKGNLLPQNIRVILEEIYKEGVAIEGIISRLE
ncbi:MAG: response regulator, partial [Candidatus Eremiobacterota bacterium]